MLRCIGCAEYGAVRVAGGAEYVMPPRLPNEPPSPARASARPGDKASAKAAEPAIRAEVRRIWFRFNVVTRNMVRPAGPGQGEPGLAPCLSVSGQMRIVTERGRRTTWRPGP